PLEGLVMGSRSGDIDASIVPILMTKMNMSADEAINYLNKKCGVLGLSGVSSDFRDLHAAAQEGNDRAKAALEVFIYKIRKYIGSYAAAMGGVDVITFAGGIGENDPYIRKACIVGLEFMGAHLDDSKNDGLRSKEAVISTDSSRVTVMVVPTDEELVIARDTCELALCGK
ncbi:MAG: acetate kinase, partial [Eubacteriales bacterium]